MYQKPTVPRSIGGVLDDSIRLFKASFTKVLPPTLLMSVFTVTQVLMQVNLPKSGGGVGAAPEAAGYVVLSLIGSLLDVVLYGAVVLIIIGITRGEAPKFATAFGGAWRRFGSMLGASILIGFIVGFGLLLAFIPVFMSLSQLPTGSTLPQIAARLTPQISLVLLLSLPIIYVFTRMMLYMVPLLGESQSASRSLGTSWRLVGGNWWRTSTVLFVVGLIVYVLILILMAIGGVVAALLVHGQMATPQAAATAGLSVAIGLAVARLVYSPLIASTLVVLYQDLQLRKGGGDLEARLGALPKG